MQEDFHYYATYCAAYIAGFSHEESLAICYSAQFVDTCSETLLEKIRAPRDAATTQLQLELMDARTDLLARHAITRIWSSFHFLPRDLFAPVKGGKMYCSKYRLICGPNGDLLKETVELARGKSLQAVGIAMHVLADTWAHMYFAGTPSLVINNIDAHFFEMREADGVPVRRKIRFHRNIAAGDDLETGAMIGTPAQMDENTIFNLGHGRAGHLPDYSFARYVYMPAWNGYQEVFKDNPSDYYHAFCQMVYALRFLRGELKEFRTETYDFERVQPYEEEIRTILNRRQPNACADWKAFGEKLSGETIGAFDIEAYQKEYKEAGEEEKPRTAPGMFFDAARAQKSMVTDRIFSSGNLLAGLSIRIGDIGSLKDLRGKKK